MSDRIAVMNGGQIEQIGSPREMYEHPATAFVADFIGSLNAVELTVTDVVGPYAVMRLDERQRVVVPVDSDVHVGDALRVAVRPERVRIAPVDAEVPETGSRLDGVVIQIVYLGMYTQFHVETRNGRMISNRLADEVLAEITGGARVALHWEPEHTSVLD